MQNFSYIILPSTPANLLHETDTSTPQEIEMPIHSNMVPYFPPLLPQVALAHIMPDNLNYQVQASFAQGGEALFFLYPVTYFPPSLPQIAFARFSTSPVITNLMDPSNNGDIHQASSQLTLGTHLSKRRRAEQNNSPRKSHKVNFEFEDKAIDPDGSVYQGGWKDGKKHGLGKFTTLKGRVYNGNWIDGKKDGYGKVTLNGKIVYDGYWKEGKKEGKGKKNYSDGSVYEGNWKEGKKHGHGTIISDETSFEGHWEKGMPHGKGTYIFPNRVIFEGQWENSELTDGKLTLGEASFLDSKLKLIFHGIVYKGKFDLTMSGYGKRKTDSTLKKGFVYIGNFLRGKYEGFGKLIDRLDRTEYEGQWKGGKPVDFKIDDENPNRILEAEVDNDVKIHEDFKQLPGYGQIKWLMPKAESCEVNFQNGDQEEPRTSTMLYEGEIFDLLAHGYGKITHPNGNIFEGDFEYNKPQHGRIIIANQNNEIWVKWEYSQDGNHQLKILYKGENFEGTNLQIEQILEDPESLSRQREQAKIIPFKSKELG